MPNCSNCGFTLALDGGCYYPECDDPVKPHSPDTITIPRADLLAIREALERIKARAYELKAGTDDWFELAEFGVTSGNALTKLEELLNG